jgi:hypothetical protein
MNGEKGDQSGLYAIPLSGGSYRQVTSSPTRDYSAAWSPDGRRIAFLRAGRQRRLMLLDVGSSQERILLPDVKIGEQVVFSNKPMLAWTPDSSALVVSMADFDTGKTSLFAVDMKSLSATTVILHTRPGRRFSAGLLAGWTMAGLRDSDWVLVGAVICEAYVERAPTRRGRHCRHWTEREAQRTAVGAERRALIFRPRLAAHGVESGRRSTYPL